MLITVLFRPISAFKLLNFYKVSRIHNIGTFATLQTDSKKNNNNKFSKLEKRRLKFFR